MVAHHWADCVDANRSTTLVWLEHLVHESAHGAYGAEGQKTNVGTRRYPQTRPDRGPHSCKATAVSAPPASTVEVGR